MGLAPREVVEQLHETINQHDPIGGRDLFAPEARLVAATGRVLSLAGLARMLTDTVTAFPDFHVTIERWVEAGDVVVTEEVLEGTHQGPFAGLAATGRPVKLPLCHVTRVVDGRIVERIAYHDTAGILRQLA
jgi:steroid delta-isomerase-like uncharacterized protein